MRPYRYPNVVLLACVAAGLSLPSCKSCEKDKPYVPYTIDPSSALRDPSQIPSAAAAASDTLPAGAFAVIPARRVGAATVNSLAGPISAPAGGVIEWLLEGDITGDNQPDPVAWIQSADRSSGELVYYTRSREGAPLMPRSLVPLPADFAAGPDCKTAAELRQVGTRTVAVHFTKTCSAPASGPAAQWNAAIVPMRNPALRLSVVVDQPAALDGVDVRFDGADRDGDGFDDLTVSLQMAAGPKSFDERLGENPTAIIRYFDRSAGLSRDPHEPKRSFDAIARRIKRLAKGKDKAVAVAEARAARRLYKMVCEGTPTRAVRVSEAAVPCANANFLSSLALATIEACLGMNNAVGAWCAIGTYEQLVRGKASGTDLDEARKQIEAAFPVRPMNSYFLPFGPVVVASGVARGPLAFQRDGTLMIRTDTSVMRFAPKQRIAVADPDTGPLALWDIRIATPDGATAFAGIEDRCDGGQLVAKLFKGSELISVLLPVASDDATACAKVRPGEARFVTAMPMNFFEAGLNVVVGDASLWISTDGKQATRRAPMPSPGVLGGPTSPDGKWVAKATPLGVFVTGSNGAGQLVRSSTMQKPYEQLSACTVSNANDAVACMEGSTTRVFIAP